MSIDLDLRWKSVLFDIPDVVEFSVFIGVGGWGWYSSSNVVFNIVDFCPFKNNPSTSASADDFMTLSNMLHTAWKGPFVGCVSVGDKFWFFDGELN